MIALCLALLFTGCPPLAADAGSSETGTSVQEASRLLKNEDYERAIRICKQTVEPRSRDEETQCLLILAVAYNRIGEPRKAIDAARQAADSTADPRLVRVAARELGSAHFSKATELKKLGNVEGASKHLKSAEAAFRKALDVNKESDHVTMIDLATTLFERIQVDWVALGEESDWQQADVELRELALTYLELNPSGPFAGWAREVGCVAPPIAASSSSSEDTAPPVPKGSGSDAAQSTETRESQVSARHIADEVLKPERIFAPQPEYSLLARKARIQGQVVVEAIIDKQGNAINLRVLKGLPLCLTQQAVKAVREWRFQPATLHGEPVDVYYNLKVNYRLRSSASATGGRRIQ